VQNPGERAIFALSSHFQVFGRYEDHKEAGVHKSSSAIAYEWLTTIAVTNRNLVLVTKG
jgi:hypothetical protein